MQEEKATLTTRHASQSVAWVGDVPRSACGVSDTPKSSVVFCSPYLEAVIVASGFMQLSFLLGQFGSMLLL